MTLLTYIFSTILLSWAGVAAYWLLRFFKPTLAARRVTIWLLVAGSLVLPLSPPFTQTSYRHVQQVQLKPGIISPVPVGATSLQDFCHCAQPHAGDVILYQTSLIYDFLLRNQTILLILLTGFGAMLSLRMFSQLLALFLKIGRHKAEVLEIMGLKVQMVRDVPGLSAASLHFMGKYIFWNASLDSLSAQDQKAVMLHELSHIRQHNSLEKVILALLQLIWWLNPAFYFLSKELEILSEYAADAYAIGQLDSKKQYAGLLLKLKTGEAFAPLQFFKGSQLKSRVEMILKPQMQPRMKLFPALLVWLALTLPGELAAKSVLKVQLREIEVYEFLTERNLETGQKEFCRKCTYEVVESCYLEESCDPE